MARELDLVISSYMPINGRPGWSYPLNAARQVVGKPVEHAGTETPAPVRERIPFVPQNRSTTATGGLTIAQAVVTQVTALTARVTALEAQNAGLIERLHTLEVLTGPKAMQAATQADAVASRATPVKRGKRLPKAPVEMGVDLVPEPSDDFASPVTLDKGAGPIDLDSELPF